MIRQMIYTSDICDEHFIAENIREHVHVQFVAYIIIIIIIRMKEWNNMM